MMKRSLGRRTRETIDGLALSIGLLSGSLLYCGYFKYASPIALNTCTRPFAFHASLAMCSLESCSATICPMQLTFPRTAREFPRLAMNSVFCCTAPTRQHAPTVAICGSVFHWRDTSSMNPSSVALNALLIASVVTRCELDNSLGGGGRGCHKKIRQLRSLHVHRRCQ